jgi:nucleoside diphosphate kinase
MPGAFFVLSPDCVSSGLARPILRRFTSAGLDVAHARWHRFNLEDVQRLYQRNRKGNQRSRLDELVNELFIKGDSLCGVVRATNGEVLEDVHAKIKYLKGPSNPFLCKEWQLRRALGATNKVLNLIHTSDNSDMSREEIASLFGDEFFRESLNVLELEDEVDKKNRGTAVSGLIVANKLKSQLLRIPSFRDGRMADLVQQERQALHDNDDQVTAFRAISGLLIQQEKNIDRLCPSVSKFFNALLMLGMRTHSNEPIDSTLIRFPFEIGEWDRLVLRAEDATL